MPAAERSRPERRQQLEQRLRDQAVEIDLYLELAAIYRAEGRPLEAKRVLQQALQLAPQDERVLWQHEEAILARAIQQLGEVSELATRLKTPEVERELARAQTDWANRRLEVCRARVARQPDKHQFRLLIGEALYDLGDYEQACAEIAVCFDFDAHAPAARLLQGRCLMALADDLGALAAFRAAALRRSVPAPARLRVAAMRAATEVAERLGLRLSHQRYLQALRTAEQELSSGPAAAD